MFKGKRVLTGNEDLLRIGLWSEEPSTDKESEAWYYATTVTKCVEILPNGFKILSRKDKDELYFTDSVKAAVELFLRNSKKEIDTPLSAEHKKITTKSTQDKIALLVFENSNNDSLEEYKDQSIGVTKPESEEKEVVYFFCQNQSPSRMPTAKAKYKTYEECSSTFLPIQKKNIEYMSTNQTLSQLCIKCVGTKQMLYNLEMNLNREVLVIDVESWNDEHHNQGDKQDTLDQGSQY